MGGADGVAADGHGLDDAVRVAFHDGTVHERTRVAFVGVADDVHLIALVLGAEAPFHAGREASAAATAKARLGDFVDDLLGGHFAEALTKGFVAAARDALVDVLGVDETAVAQGDAQLLAVEAHVLRVGHMFLVFRVHVEQIGDLTALDDVLVHDLLDVFGFHLGVERVVRHDLDDGSLLAEAEATRPDHLNFILQALRGENVLEVLDDFSTCRCIAASTAAAKHVHLDFCHINSSELVS